MFPGWDIAKSAVAEVGYFSQAHENTSEEVFFLLWNAPDCIKRDVQLHSKNTGLSEQTPLNPHTQKHLLKSLSYKSYNAKENEKYYLMDTD